MLGEPTRPTLIVENPKEVDSAILTFFLAYWRTKRRGGPLPLRNAFVPKEVGKYLPAVVVADALPDLEDFRFRVVGGDIAQYFLADGVGKTLREVFRGQNKTLRDGALWAYRRACEKRIPVRVKGPYNEFKGTLFPEFDALYLPYSSDGQRGDRIVNVYAFGGFANRTGAHS